MTLLPVLRPDYNQITQTEGAPLLDFGFLVLYGREFGDEVFEVFFLCRDFFFDVGEILDELIARLRCFFLIFFKVIDSTFQVGDLLDSLISLRINHSDFRSLLTQIVSQVRQQTL